MKIILILTTLVLLIAIKFDREQQLELISLSLLKDIVALPCETATPPITIPSPEPPTATPCPTQPSSTATLTETATILSTPITLTPNSTVLVTSTSIPPTAVPLTTNTPTLPLTNGPTLTPTAPVPSTTDAPTLPPVNGPTSTPPAPVPSTTDAPTLPPVNGPTSTPPTPVLPTLSTNPIPSTIILLPSQTSIPVGITPTSLATIPTGTVGQNQQAAVQTALAELNDGRLAFNPPDEMQVGELQMIAARISIDPTADIISNFPGSAPPQVEPVKIDQLMKVQLVGEANGFQITALNAEEQIVGGDKFTQWAWNVTPLEAGTKHLYLRISVTLRIIGRGEGTKDFPVRTKEVKVKVNLGFTISQFVTSYWQWIATSIAIPVIVGVLKLYNTKKEKKRRSAGKPYTKNKHEQHNGRRGNNRRK